MIADHWPLYGLRLRTPRLELRLPDLDDLSAMGDVAAAGIHDAARRVRLNRDSWAAARTVPVEIEGLEPCLPMFGI